MVRNALSADVPAIVAVVNDAFQVEREFRRGERTNAAAIQRLLPELLGFEENGRVEGVVHVRVDGSSGYFGILSVAKSAQGKGVGRRLLDAAEQRCRAAGCTEMTLSTGEMRTDVIGWYSRLGYALTRSETSNSGAFTRPITVVHMSKPLQ